MVSAAAPAKAITAEQFSQLTYAQATGGGGGWRVVGVLFVFVFGLFFVLGIGLGIGLCSCLCFDWWSCLGAWLRTGQPLPYGGVQWH